MPTESISEEWRLILIRRLRLIAWPMIAALWMTTANEGPAQSSMPTAKRLEFEVASVRQNKSGDRQQSSFSLDNGNLYSTVNKEDALVPNGGYFYATNVPLMRYIVFAYGLTGTQELALRFNYFAGVSSSVPGWVNMERFDIKARVDGRPSKEQLRQMMRTLLADRFKLVVHKETREAPVFALVLSSVGKTGPALQTHPANEACPTSAAIVPTPGSAPEPRPEKATGTNLPEVCGVLAHLAPSVPGRVRFGGRDVTLDLLASSLPTQTGMATVSRPVVDKTGLTGTFDFSLEWMPDMSGPQPDAATAQPEESGPTFGEAIREQLGFKLKPEKGSVEILVIDHVEHPSEN